MEVDDDARRGILYRVDTRFDRAHGGPLIHLWLLESGTHRPVLLKAKGFRPYFYTSAKDVDQGALEAHLHAKLQHAFGTERKRWAFGIDKFSYDTLYGAVGAEQRLVHAVEVEQKYEFGVELTYNQDGYAEHPNEVRKIVLAFPGLVPLAREYFWEGGHTNSEADVEFTMRFMLDTGAHIGHCITVPRHLAPDEEVERRCGNVFLGGREYVVEDYRHLRVGPKAAMRHRVAFEDIETIGLDARAKETNMEGKTYPTTTICTYITLHNTERDRRVFLCRRDLGNMSADRVEGDSEVIWCADEADLLYQRTALLLDAGVTAIVTYNGRNFDIPFLAERADELGLKSLCFGYLEGVRPRVRRRTTGSKQTGQRDATDTEMPGVLSLDVMEMIRTNPTLQASFKINSLKLGAVADCINERSDEQKIDLPYTEFPALLWGARRAEGLYEIAKYNRMDVLALEAICRRIGFLPDVLARAVINNVDPEAVINRGQVYKNKPLILGVLRKRGFVLKTRRRTNNNHRDDNDALDPNHTPEEDEEEDESFQGAIVLDAPALGAYLELLVTLDAEAMYPNNIIGFNICPTTLVSRATIVARRWERYKHYQQIEIDGPEHTAYYVTPNIRVGILAEVLIALSAARKTEKGAMGAAERLKLACAYLLKHYDTMDASRVAEEAAIQRNRLLLDECAGDYCAQRKCQKDISDAEERITWLTGELARRTTDDLQRMREEAEDEQGRRNVLQNGLKLSANSLYGGCGGETSCFFSRIIAASVTAAGRWLIHLVRDRVSAYFSPENGYPFRLEPVYGDSVTGDTALVVRLYGQIHIVRVDELVPHDSPLWVPRGDDGKEEARVPGLEVWSSAEGVSAFTPVRRLIRHVCEKPIVRVLTHSGVVDCTTDHSLLLCDGTEISPDRVRVGTELLHSDDAELVRAIESGVTECSITTDEAYAMGLFLAESSGVPTMRYRSMFYNEHCEKRVPTEILCAPLPVVQAFWDGFYAGDGARADQKGKQVTAGLLLLARRLGYSVSINDRTDKPDVFRITCSLSPASSQKQPPPQAVKKRVRTLTTTTMVYDLETESHHFGVAPGSLVVHNTDSVFFWARVVPEARDRVNVRTMIEYGQQFAAYANREIYRAMHGLPDDAVVTDDDARKLCIRFAFEKVFIKILFGRRREKTRTQRAAASVVGMARLHSQMVDEEDDDDDEAPPLKRQCRRAEWDLGGDGVVEPEHIRCIVGDLRKRYAGLMQEDSEKPPVEKSRGTDDVRRETVEFVKDMIQLIRDRLLCGGVRNVRETVYEDASGTVVWRDKWVQKYGSKKWTHHYWLHALYAPDGRQRAVTSYSRALTENFSDGRFTTVHYLDAADKVVATQYQTNGMVMPWLSDPTPLRREYVRTVEESVQLDQKSILAEELHLLICLLHQRRVPVHKLQSIKGISKALESYSGTTGLRSTEEIVRHAVGGGFTGLARPKAGTRARSARAKAVPGVVKMAMKDPTLGPGSRVASVRVAGAPGQKASELLATVEAAQRAQDAFVASGGRLQFSQPCLVDTEYYRAQAEDKARMLLTVPGLHEYFADIATIFNPRIARPRVHLTP